MKNGFTLIELLVVMAVLGVLAGIMILVVNPLEQLGRAQDSGRKSTVGQIGHGFAAYYTIHGARYPASDSNWIATLQTAGELKSAPQNPAYITGVTNCTTNVVNGYCYSASGTPVEVVVYVRLESTSEISKCPAGSPLAFAVWSSVDGRAGVVCKTAGSEPAPGAQMFVE